MVGLTDEAVLFHPLDQARGVVVADAKLPLELAGGRLLAFRDDLHGAPVQRGLAVFLTPGHAEIEAELAGVLRRLGHRRPISGRARPAPVIGAAWHSLV